MLRGLLKKCYPNNSYTWIIFFTCHVYLRYEAHHGNDASEFKIGIHNQENHVVTPAEFMQGCLKRMVGMIRTIEPVRTHLLE